MDILGADLLEIGDRLSPHLVGQDELRPQASKTPVVEVQVAVWQKLSIGRSKPKTENCIPCCSPAAGGGEQRVLLGGADAVSSETPHAFSHYLQ